jgi:hypothetical protein
MLTQLHAMHRSMYVAERQAYYDRAMRAVTMPSLYMSLILDGKLRVACIFERLVLWFLIVCVRMTNIGMQQSHSELPHRGTSQPLNDSVIQHIQGVIEHGRAFTIYRSFANVRHDRNLLIHCLLMQLEDRLCDKRFGNKLPETIFIQIDGGAENANLTLLGLLTLMAHKQLRGIKEIILTRLPVGHTHEDIDAKFGTLWKATRNVHILTPQDYKAYLETVFCGKKEEEFKVIDIICVPDYETIFESCMDNTIRDWAKRQNAQLQWKFTHLQHKDSAHDVNCHVTYRPYSCDEVFEIVPVEEPTNPLSVGYRPQIAENITWEPRAPEVINPLSTIPSGNIYAKAFVDGSAANLIKSVRAIKQLYRSRPIEGVSTAWDDHVAAYPDTDDVADYLRTPNAEYHIPFFIDLFGGGQFCQSMRRAVSVNDDVFNGLPIQRVTNTASVKHRGNSKAELHPEPRVVTSNPYEVAISALTKPEQAKRLNSLLPENTTVAKLKKMINHVNANMDQKEKRLNVSGTKIALLESLQNYFNDEGTTTVPKKQKIDA